MRGQPINLTLNDDARAAVKAFRDAKPWRGTTIERGAKFSEHHRGLCRAYDLETMLVRDDQSSDPDGTSAWSHFEPTTNKIILRGRLSVVTYLFCFGCARGASRMAALKWARETFAHFFPRSFAGCRSVGGLLVRS